MIIAVREIAVAVKDVGAAAKTFAAIGLDPSPIFADPTPPIQAVCTSIAMPNAHLGVMQSLGDNTPISRFIDKKGEGLFSITLLVRSVKEVMEKWKVEGIDFVLDEPLQFEDYLLGRVTLPIVRVNWTRPATMHGLLIELHEFRDKEGNLFYPAQDVPLPSSKEGAA